MEWQTSILFYVLGWVALVLLARYVIAPWLKDGPKREVMMGLAWRITRLYCAAVHRAKFIGEEELRKDVDAGPMIVISNHTGAVDPLLLASGCKFHIRWMMASDMMSPKLDWIWSMADIIPVDRDGHDSGPLREAIRHLKDGGVIGIFPEGRIAVPPRQIRPFFPGVGLLVSRTGAPVLLSWISGTPDTNDMKESLLTPSHARVDYLELVKFKEKTDAATVTATLRDKLARASGWVKNDVALPLVTERGSIK
ncbi:MAG TPA: lysophospholipid acyltransferase family protein [Phycisphaerales bacterium]|nr:lysophospholipid acyltransferase family protein [Phycisphaerales bacterium]